MLGGALALFTLLTASGHAVDCPASAERDKQFIIAEIARLKVLAPELPAGWKLYDTRQTPLAAQSDCGKDGAPSTPPVRVEYEVTAYPADAPQFRIRELRGGVDANSKATAPSIQKATEDLQAASKSRDMAAVQKANAEMQQAMAALNAGNQKSMADVQEIARLEKLPQPSPIRIQLLGNYDVMTLCEGRTELKMPGASYAFRFDQRPSCTVGPFVGAAVTAAVVVGIGDWRLDGGRQIANFEYVRGTQVVPFYAVYTLVVVVNGSDAAAVRATAAHLDMGAPAKEAAARTNAPR